MGSKMKSDVLSQDHELDNYEGGGRGKNEGTLKDEEDMKMLGRQQQLNVSIQFEWHPALRRKSDFLIAQLPLHFDFGLRVHFDEHVGNRARGSLFWTDRWWHCWPCLGILPLLDRLWPCLCFNLRDGVDVCSLTIPSQGALTLTFCSSPTSGGQYHWVSEFAPKSCQRFLSWLTGRRRI